jgi:Sulfotransferase domain
MRLWAAVALVDQTFEGLESVHQEMRAYFGHHKCASTWVWQLMHRVCREIGLRHYLVLYERSSNGHGPLTAYSNDGRERAKGSFERALLPERAAAAGADFVSCIKADREQLEALAPTRAFHVIRDPRDIIVSGYFSHRNSHPTNGIPGLAEHRERLREVSKEEGLVLEMDFSLQSLLDMAEWDYNRPEILELRLEELAASPYDGFVRVFQHLELLPDDEPAAGRELATVYAKRTLNRLASRRMFARLRRPMPATGEILLGAVYGNRFEAQTNGRRAGAEDTGSHYRKGVAGDWVNHFTPKVSEAFEERFAGLVDQLGYN